MGYYTNFIIKYCGIKEPISSDIYDQIEDGDGEEEGDIWNEYYLNGKYQTAWSVVVIPEFDLNGEWKE